jgi:hypothetical protein
MDAIPEQEDQAFKGSSTSEGAKSALANYLSTSKVCPKALHYA